MLFHRISRPFTVSAMAMANLCPWCSSTFAGMDSIRTHIHRWFTNGVCAVDCAIHRVFDEQFNDASAQCPNCSPKHEDIVDSCTYVTEKDGSPAYGFIDLRSEDQIQRQHGIVRSSGQGNGCLNRWWWEGLPAS